MAAPSGAGPGGAGRGDPTRPPPKWTGPRGLISLTEIYRHYQTRVTDGPHRPHTSSATERTKVDT